MSPFQWLVAIFIGYWVVVLIWIKGTDPLASDLWKILWWPIKGAIYLGLGIVGFALLCR